MTDWDNKFKKSDLYQKLEYLVGSWKIEISLMSFRENQNETENGKAKFEWLNNSPLLIQRSEIPNTEFPTSISVIGYDDKLNKLSMQYSDSRGASRIYNMTIDKNKWTIKRKSDNLSQEFIGMFNSDKSIIKGEWRKIKGGKWQHDFNQTFKRI